MLSELIGGTPKENAEITRRILTGEETGPKRDVFLMNAGMSLYLGIDGITLAEGIEKAKEMIDSGKALEKLEEFVKETNAAPRLLATVAAAMIRLVSPEMERARTRSSEVSCRALIFIRVLSS